MVKDLTKHARRETLPCMATVTSLGMVSGPALATMKARYAAQVREAQAKGATASRIASISKDRGVLLNAMGAHAEGTTRPSHAAMVQASRDLTFGGGTVSGPSEILLLTGLALGGVVLIGGAAYFGGRFMKRARS